ncbi:MAG: hypothetical protein IPK82_17430 [Polyangiaceae bacterium]|nr:hypothetical protein [Polyangiaceae bacterium]
MNLLRVSLLAAVVTSPLFALTACDGDSTSTGGGGTTSGTAGNGGTGAGTTSTGTAGSNTTSTGGTAGTGGTGGSAGSTSSTGGSTTTTGTGGGPVGSFDCSPPTGGAPALKLTPRYYRDEPPRACSRRSRRHGTPLRC